MRRSACRQSWLVWGSRLDRRSLYIVALRALAIALPIRVGAIALRTGCAFLEYR